MSAAGRPKARSLRRNWALPNWRVSMRKVAQ